MRVIPHIQWLPAAVLLLILAAGCATAPESVPKPEEIDAPEIDESMKRPKPETEAEAVGDEQDGAESGEYEGKKVVSVQDLALPRRELGSMQEKRLRKLLENLVYLVYLRDGERPDEVSSFAVKAANEFLEERGIDVVEYRQVRDLLGQRRDQYMKETEGTISALRWIACTFNADVFGEMQVRYNSEAEEETFYATAGVSALFRNTENGEEWAEASFRSTTASVSDVSRGDAELSAVEKAVRKVMGEAVAEAQKRAVEVLREGISYRVELRNTYNEEIIANYFKQLENKVESISKEEFSPELSVYRIKYIGSVTDLEHTALETAKEVGGLEKMFLVYQRGHTIAFNTGM